MESNMSPNCVALRPIIPSASRRNDCEKSSITPSNPAPLHIPTVLSSPLSSCAPIPNQPAFSTTAPPMIASLSVTPEMFPFPTSSFCHPT
jgi:hypothetical protein